MSKGEQHRPSIRQDLRAVGALGTLTLSLGIHGNEKLRGAARGRHLEDPASALPEDNRVVSAPARAVGVPSLTECHRRPARECYLLESAVARRVEPEPLPVGREERKCGSAPFGATERLGIHLIHGAQVQLLVGDVGYVRSAW